MKKITYTDEQLKRAAGVIVRALERSIPDPKECSAPFQYSPEFLKKWKTSFNKKRTAKRRGVLGVR